MNLYLGIGDMPIYNFDKVLNTNNMAYMVVGWDERQSIEVPEEVYLRWQEIYNEYCKRTANNEALTYYSLSCEIGYLEMRYTAIYSLLSNLCDKYKKEIGLRLNKWGVPFNIDGKIEPQIKNIETNLRIAKQNIDFKKKKLESLKNNESEHKSIIRQKIGLERIIGLKINIKETSVEEWIELFNEANNVVQNQKKINNG